MRNWGSVRIPVRVKRVEPELRRPVVTCWSVGPTGIKVEVLPAEAGTPGNHPVVFPAVLPVKREGWVPPDPQIVRFFMRTLPKYQSKPRALASSWETSTNLALMLTWGGEALRTWMAASMVSRSWRVARTMRRPSRSLKKMLLGGLRSTPRAVKKFLAARVTSSMELVVVRNFRPPAPPPVWVPPPPWRPPWTPPGAAETRETIEPLIWFWLLPPPPPPREPPPPPPPPPPVPEIVSPKTKAPTLWRPW